MYLGDLYGQSMSRHKPGDLTNNMQLTKFTDLALRVLIYLGMHQERLITIAEIAEAHHVPKNHLMKVVHRLAQQGYLETVRGNSGGIRLAREPKMIFVGPVIRDVGENIDILGCFDLAADEDCPLLPSCILRVALIRARDQFMAALDGVTLEDILPRPTTKKAMPPVTIQPLKQATE